LEQLSEAAVPLAVPGERARGAEAGMNTARTAVIVICVAIGASGYLLLRGSATDEVMPAQEARAQTKRLAASDPDMGRIAVQAPDARTLDKVKQPAFEPDAPELQQPSQTLDEVLDAVNAGIGPDGEYVDREALAAVLSSDPELARLLDESEF
jgi:hypothetical protein